MRVQTQPLTDITHQALRILIREMGIVSTIRFMNQFTTGFGDYTQERDVLFRDMTLDDIINDIKKLRTR